MTPTPWQTASASLRLAAQLVDGVQAGLASRGFTDVRPVHGFAFAAIADGASTAAELAVALDVSKQAAAQLVDHLVAHRYLTKRPDPRDGRAQLLVLTRRGRACMTAAQQAAVEVVGGWQGQVSAASFAGFERTLHVVSEPGRLRPAW